jgi:Lysine methyltransferase
VEAWYINGKVVICQTRSDSHIFRINLWSFFGGLLNYSGNNRQLVEHLFGPSKSVRHCAGSFVEQSDSTLFSNMELNRFTFNFLSDNDDDETLGVPTIVKQVTDLSTQDASSRNTRPFRWVDNVHSLLEERSQEELIYKEVPVAKVSTQTETKEVETIRVIDLNYSSYRRPNAPDDEPTIINGDSDIVSGVYEGGLKVWECSLDLVEYLATTIDRDDLSMNSSIAEGWPSKVWELGCGHGLPGCYLLKKWLHGAKRSEPWSVTFSDYNEEVILDSTLSNIVLNAQIGMPLNGDTTMEPIKVEDFVRHIHLGSGDWMDQSAAMLDNNDGRPETFDLILAAETIYTEQACRETAALLLRHLHPSRGIALVATKRFYFGVGGGIDCFRTYASGLSVETVKVIDSGSGNIREILKVRLDRHES